jgi:hypothetical protein
MVLVKIPVFYNMVPCRLVDCLQASLLDSSSRYLHSAISQKTRIFKTCHGLLILVAVEISDSFRGEIAYCRVDWMDPTDCLEVAETGNFILLLRIKPSCPGCN